MVLSVAAVVPYVAFLDGYFLADDLMVEDFLLEDGSFSPAKLGNHFFPVTGYVGRQIYRPFDFVVLSVDWLLWGTNPVGYHLSNLAFHVWCTLLVFFLIRRLGRGGDLFPALLGGILFALHPLNPEAVQWIVGRVDLTSCFFTLLAMLFFVRYRRTGRGSFLAGTLASLVLGLLSKEVVIFLPAYFVLHDLCLFQPFKKWREARRSLLDVHVLSGLIVAAYFLLRLLCFGDFFGKYDSAGQPVTACFSTRWAEGLGHVASLMEQMLFPLRESVYAASEGFWIWACLLVGYLALVLLAVVRGLTRGTGPGGAALFSGLWLAATLAPLAYLLLLLPISRDHLNARLAYLPLAAFSVAFPLWLFTGERWRGRAWVRLRIAAGCILPVVFLPLTCVHNGLFHQAGRAVNALRVQVLEHYEGAGPETPVLIENPPLVITGVYALRTGLPYLLRPPFSPVRVPVQALSLMDRPEDLGRYLERYRKRPLILRWHEESMRIEVVTRPRPGPLPRWRGEALTSLEAFGAERRLEDQGLVLTRSRSGQGFRVRTPVLHVHPGDLDSLVLDLRLRAGAALVPRILISGRGGQGEPMSFTVAAGPGVEMGGLRRRIWPLRFHPEIYGEKMAFGRFSGLRRIEFLEVLFPESCEQVEIQGLELRHGFPGLILTGPRNGVRLHHLEPDRGFGFLALDGVRYYCLVLDIQGLGARKARFDAWRLNRGQPVRAGETVTKPLHAAGNLDRLDFAVDLQKAPPGEPGQVLPFSWKIQALADPERPWLILAESETRRGTIR